MILEIPVSSFTKKIILKTETEPVRIDRFSILHSCFTDIRTGKPEQTGSAVELLNESIVVQVNKKMPKNKVMYLYQAGVNLHRHFINSMLTWIEGYVMSGGNASEAIRKYFYIYDIWDEDMDIESTHRQWQRYFFPKKNKIYSKIIATKRLQKNTQKSQKIYLIDVPAFHKDFAEFVFENLDYFMTKNDKFRYKLYIALKIFIMHRILQYNIPELQKLFRMHRSSIYKRIKYIESIIQYEEDFGSKIKELIS